jgi:hypothetical protein
MFSLRRATRILAATALMGGAFGEAHGQTADVPRPPTADQIASTIAATINANTVKAPGAAVAFEYATSHGNVVEVRYQANAGFISLKANASQTRMAKLSYYCKEGRLAYLKQGVVIHEEIATPNNSDRIDFTFDQASCDSLPKVALADSKTLAEIALTVAKAENEVAGKNPGKPFGAAFHPSEATAHEGVVDERFTVQDAAAQAINQANRGKIAAVVTGYFCAKYHDVISRGLAFHNVFVSANDSPVIDLTIDRSTC